MAKKKKRKYKTVTMPENLAEIILFISIILYI
jgi:hypothetical protein